MGQKTIYVKDEVRWAEVKESALKLDMGIGEYLLRWDKIQGEPKEGGNSQLDRIEAMLDRLVPEKRGTPIYGDGVSSTKVIPIPEDDMDLLKRKQSEIDSIKAKKIAMTKGNIRPDAEVKNEVMNQLGQVRSGMIPKKSWSK